MFRLCEVVKRYSVKRLPMMVIEIKFFAILYRQKLNTEAYRSGHNGPDSKFFEELAVCSAKKARKIRGFLRFEN